ncbi:MAG: hypothetical protein CM15mP103_05840 [Gammaproteobacteria bacterium]|nr:MAG: hypothetical protein CM15mP103_05840 [Gammaproteobacteria bacterium]
MLGFLMIGGWTVMSQDNGDAKAFIADLVARSRAAQKQIEHYSQERVDALIRAMVWSVARPGVAEEIAQFTVDETQLGNYDGKFLKIQRKTRATLLDIIHDKSVGIIEEYPERNIRVLAKPLGVIGALAPSTNPEAPRHQRHSRRQRPQLDHRRAPSTGQADQKKDL